jgi:hypothetical protein
MNEPAIVRLKWIQGTASVGFPPSFQPLRPSDITSAFV